MRSKGQTCRRNRLLLFIPPSIEMIFLLDGYNLLHALGLASRKMEGKALERARIKMLDWLGEHHRDSNSRVRVVFDALNATRGDQTRQSYRGIDVEYSFRELADDRIEAIIREESRPKRLRVVSNDTRIQAAARRRGCEFWSCEDYVDWLIREESKGPQPLPIPEKDESADESERNAWLAVFENRS